MSLHTFLSVETLKQHLSVYHSFQFLLHHHFTGAYLVCYRNFLLPRFNISCNIIVFPKFRKVSSLCIRSLHSSLCILFMTISFQNAHFHIKDSTESFDIFNEEKINKYTGCDGLIVVYITQK